ncbi:MAG: hypothetical protein NZ700_14540 [Gemmataceae bacterium]|nr:hypothetical protein [Gemmataceae bacterium]MDW8264709.1 hypothetical protein [Gemmataceae bacterium]
MADRSTQLILDALSRALAEPAGLPLHAARGQPGLLPATVLGRQVGQRCLEAGWLRPAGDGRPGDRVLLTDRGLTYLLQQRHPRLLLEDLVRALEARQEQWADLLAVVHAVQRDLEGLRESIRRILEELALSPTDPAPATSNGTASESSDPVLTELADWQAGHGGEDCPLPELYRRVAARLPALTIGRFHDRLRRLYADRRVALHPWTGPLPEMPEPACALLVGHEVAYYASNRAG